MNTDFPVIDQDSTALATKDSVNNGPFALPVHVPDSQLLCDVHTLLE